VFGQIFAIRLRVLPGPVTAETGWVGPSYWVSPNLARFWMSLLSPEWGVTKVAIGAAWACGLAAVVSSFVRGLPGDGGEGALEEGVVDDVALVVFAFDDPVAGVDFALAGVGEDGRRLSALRGVYEDRSAGAKGVHVSSPGGVVLPTRLMIPPRS
jgi:hypothetical protein